MLEQRSLSPYPPEPPRRSRAVELCVRLARRFGRGGHATPHLSGGSDAAKVQWEYEAAPAFFKAIGRWVGMDVLRGKDVLDVGCGWGGKLIHFAERSGLRSATGFDLPGVFRPEVAEAFARERGVQNCRFMTGYAERIPFDDQSFDVLIMEDVLEHVADPERSILECRRVLRPGGLLVAKFPSFRMLTAHHLDRAIGVPGLHYLLPIRTWAAGLNHLLLASPEAHAYEPFSEVAPTRFGRPATRNLNGLDVRGLRGIVERSGLEVSALELVPFPAARARTNPVHAAYRLLFRAPMLRELLASFVLFVGRRP